MRALNLVLTVLFQSLRAVGRSRSDVILENLALRQQIAVLTRTKHRPRFQAADRVLWVALHRSWRRWQQSVLLCSYTPGGLRLGLGAPERLRCSCFHYWDGRSRSHSILRQDNATPSRSFSSHSLG